MSYKIFLLGLLFIAPNFNVAQISGRFVNPWSSATLLPDALPFGVNLKEVKDPNELTSIKQWVHKLDLYAIDSGKSELVDKGYSKQWRLKHVSCNFQHGRIDQSMIYNNVRTFVATDTMPLFTLDQIHEFFSADSSWNVNPIVYSNMRDVMHQTNTWMSVQLDNVLIFFMWRAMPDLNHNNSNEKVEFQDLFYQLQSKETYSEDFWYYFEMIE